MFLGLVLLPHGQPMTLGESVTQYWAHFNVLPSFQNLALQVLAPLVTLQCLLKFKLSFSSFSKWGLSLLQLVYHIWKLKAELDFLTPLLSRHFFLSFHVQDDMNVHLYFLPVITWRIYFPSRL